MNDLIEGIAHQGDIRIRGRSLYDPLLEVIALRKRIGMVFQKSNPFPKSIYENVVYSLRMAVRPIGKTSTKRWSGACRELLSGRGKGSAR
jgi:ABC-type phosphate transport system ATPase subunit